MSLVTLRASKPTDLNDIIDTEKKAASTGNVISWPAQKHQEAMAHETFFHYVIEEKSTKAFLGYVICRRDSDDNYEIMRLVVTKKSKGYGSEVIRLLIHHAFNTCNCNRVWLDVRSHNTRAFELYKRLGFVHEGTLRNCVKLGDQYVSVHVLSILKAEYETFFSI